MNEAIYLKCNHVTNCWVGVFLQRSVMTSLLLRLASLFQEQKDPITQTCKATPDKEQYLVSWSEAALAFSFYIETRCRCTVSFWSLKLDRPNPTSYLPTPFTNTAVTRQPMEKLSAIIGVAAIDKLLFYIHRMSAGLLPDKYSMMQGSDLPRGTFTSFCT